MKRLALLLLLVVVLTAVSTAQERFSAQVLDAVDGDTIAIFRSGEIIAVRLDGIDCPELEQDFGQLAKEYTSAIVRGRVATIAPRDVDRYGRLVARVFVGEKDLSLELVQAGLAWHYTEYSEDPVLARAELQARLSRLGIWSEARPTPPWVFRDQRAPGESAWTGTIARTSQRDLLLYYGGFFLGCLTCPATNARSIWNTSGTYGSPSSLMSIWNPQGSYGSATNRMSPWNLAGDDPPRVVDTAGEAYGRFTVGRHRDRTTDPFLVFLLNNYATIRQNLEAFAVRVR